LQIKSSSKKSL